MSQAGSFNNGGIVPPGTVVETLTGNTGGPVGPDGLNNINVVGDNVGVTVVGTPGTNTLTISLIGGGDAAEDFPTDFGMASASGGVLNIIADTSTLHAGSTVSFSGSGNTVKFNITDVNNNTIVGEGSGNATISGINNTVFGEGSATGLTSAENNTIIGQNAATGIDSGSHNVIIGDSAGSNYVGSESSNILLNALGTANESHVLRVGEGTGAGTGQLNKSFVSGIVGVTPDTADGLPVFIGSVGQLGTVGNGGTMLVSTLTGDGAVVVHPLAGNINIVGDGSTAAVTASPGTHTLTISAIGGGGGTLNDLVGDDGTPVTPLAGVINVIAGTSTQHSGSSVSFTGTVAHILNFNVTDANNNTIIGQDSGNATLTGTDNTVLGQGSAFDLTSGSSNTIIGQDAGPGIQDGAHNIIIGSTAGTNYVSSESSNILLGSTGTAAESHALRVGTGTGTGVGQLNKSFVHGIVGITPATADGIPVFIGSTGQLGTVGTGGATLVSTLTGNTGGAVGPSAGNINIVGDGTTIQITGNPGTNTLTVVGLGGGGGDLTQLSGDTGFALPVAGIIDVITGNSTQNCGSTVLFDGSGNQLLLEVTDNNDNTIIGANSGNTTVSGTNNTVLGQGCADALSSGSSNIFIGKDTGKLVTTGSGNFICGDASLQAVLQGTTTSTGLYAFGASTGLLFLHNWGGSSAQNTFVGYGSGSSFNAGQQVSTRKNTACGTDSLSSLTTAVNNTAFGSRAGSNITTGNFNALIGTNAGFSYTGNESNNVAINTIGGTGESNTLRIGANTGTGIAALNRAFIAGIRGITTGVADAIPVIIDSNGQLGTAGGSAFINTLTGNTGGPVSSLAGNINVVGDGTSINVVGSPGLHKLTISAIGGSSSFLAYLNTPVTVPNNQSPQTIIYDTIVYNNGGDFNLGTSIFTAPITGEYNFSCNVSADGTFLDQSPIVYVTLRTTARNFIIIGRCPVNKTGVTAVLNPYVMTGNNFYTRMTAGDTASITVTGVFAPMTPQTLTISGINGPTQSGSPIVVPGLYTFFSGSLV